jgi:hypothetical protein
MTSSQSDSFAAELLARALTRDVSIKFRLGPHGRLQLRVARGGLSKTFSEPLEWHKPVSSQLEELCRQALLFEAFSGTLRSAETLLLDLTTPQISSADPTVRAGTEPPRHPGRVTCPKTR